MKALRTVLAALALGALALAPAAQAQQKGTVGVSMPTKSSARWIDDGNNMVKALKEKGYAVDLQYAEDDIPNQLAQIENMITKGVKVLVIAAIDGTTLSDALQQAAGKGIKVNVTLTFTPAQAILAAEAGAYIVSPFLGRLDDIATDSLKVLSDICEIYAVQGYETQVLAASLRHPMHVVEAARMGADIATMPFKVFQALVKHPLTDAGFKRFSDDWERAKPNLGELFPSMQEA